MSLLIPSRNTFEKLRNARRYTDCVNKIKDEKMSVELLSTAIDARFEEKTSRSGTFLMPAREKAAVILFRIENAVLRYGFVEFCTVFILK